MKTKYVLIERGEGFKNTYTTERAAIALLISMLDNTVLQTTPTVFVLASPQLNWNTRRLSVNLKGLGMY